MRCTLNWLKRTTQWQADREGWAPTRLVPNGLSRAPVPTRRNIQRHQTQRKNGIGLQHRVRGPDLSILARRGMCTDSLSDQHLPVQGSLHTAVHRAIYERMQVKPSLEKPAARWHEEAGINWIRGDRLR